MIEKRRGPIRALLIASVVSAVLGAMALGLVVYDYTTRGEIRVRAAEDSCFLLRGLVFAAAPRQQLARATAYINATALRDCRTYGEKLAAHP